MRQHFVQEIENINQEIIRMGSLVDENIIKASKALLKQDATLAGEVIKADNKVNELELAISDRCAILIAREQPVARDLRHIIACLKVVADIERIGDYAVHVAKRAKDFTYHEKYNESLLNIPQILDLGRGMLKDAIAAMIQADDKLALEVAKRDKKIDALSKQVYRELLAVMLNNKAHIKQATKLLFLNRLLERLGDHVVNICSWALYVSKGIHKDL